MNSFNRYSFFYGLSIVSALVFLFLSLWGNASLGGWALMSTLLSLALAIRGNEVLKGFSYTTSILAAISLALYYPGYFLQVGDYKLSKLIVPLLQIIMFGMGTEMSLKDFANVVKMPKKIIVGVVCQFTIMPLTGYFLANAFNFPPEIAAGIILIGCSPSGLASNVMCFLARANLVLSVSVTTVCTLIAPVATPLLMKLLGGSFVSISFWDMVWDITKIVLLPLAAGLIFHYLLRGRSKMLDKAMPLVSMIGIALILVVIISSGRDNLIKVGGLLILVTLIHNLTGFFLGYWSSRLLKFPEEDCRTIAIEVGMQNGGLASGIALTMGKAATVGLAPAIFGPLMNVTGSTLASWWHNRPPDGKTEASEPSSH